MRYCDATVKILQETGNPGVMHGDCGLLDSIFFEVNPDSSSNIHPLDRWDRVLNALSRTPGILEPRYCFLGGGNRKVRAFYLPENLQEGT